MVWVCLQQFEDSSAGVRRRDRSDNYSELWRMHGAHGGAMTAVDVYSNEVDKVACRVNA